MSNRGVEIYLDANYDKWTKLDEELLFNDIGVSSHLKQQQLTTITSSREMNSLLTNTYWINCYLAQGFTWSEAVSRVCNVNVDEPMLSDDDCIHLSLDSVRPDITQLLRTPRLTRVRQSCGVFTSILCSRDKWFTLVSFRLVRFLYF